MSLNLALLEKPLSANPAINDKWKWSCECCAFLQHRNQCTCNANEFARTDNQQTATKQVSDIHATHHKCARTRFRMRVAAWSRGLVAFRSSAGMAIRLSQSILDVHKLPHVTHMDSASICTSLSLNIQLLHSHGCTFASTSASYDAHVLIATHAIE